MIHFADLEVGQHFNARFVENGEDRIERCIRIEAVRLIDKKGYNALILSGDDAGKLMHVDPTEGVYPVSVIHWRQ